MTYPTIQNLSQEARKELFKLVVSKVTDKVEEQRKADIISGTAKTGPLPIDQTLARELNVNPVTIWSWKKGRLITNDRKGTILLNKALEIAHKEAIEILNADNQRFTDAIKDLKQEPLDLETEERSRSKGAQK